MTVQDACDRGCGIVKFGFDDITVRVCVDTNEASYFYRCPECGMVVSRAVHRYLRELLINSGVKVVPWFLPEDLFEQHNGPPLVLDDLIDLHQELESL